MPEYGEGRRGEDEGGPSRNTSSSTSRSQRCPSRCPTREKRRRTRSSDVADFQLRSRPLSLPTRPGPGLTLLLAVSPGPGSPSSRRLSSKISQHQGGAGPEEEKARMLLGNSSTVPSGAKHGKRFPSFRKKD